MIEKYRTDYAFTAKELFAHFNLKKRTKLTRKITYNEYRVDRKIDLCGQIITYLFYLIITDMIENNISFELPLKGRDAQLYIASVEGEHFRQMYVKGGFDGLDFLSSNFMGFRFRYRYKTRGGYRDKPIYINNKWKQIFYQKINNGQKYY